ncbi:MAG TPA: hypothetical protein EYG18_04625 [Micavibrio sp.]|nr:hypothetical protein [Micavibrio sp.]HIL28537.1 hypothetical protein [Micavibrio sp.]
MMKKDNPYAPEIYANLPRILSLFDPDRLSPCYGVGDRDYWGWKTKDFINGTYQGAAHGLALLLKHDLLPDFLGREQTLELIGAIFKGTAAITRKDGSLEEAYPYEKSFCVTSLVAYDLAAALLELKDELSKELLESHLSVIRPLIEFTIESDEQHGIISNHLASALAALVLWEKLTGHRFGKAAKLLQIITDHQSEEGWFSEYDGADIGYQTLATSYLAAYDQGVGGNGLDSEIERSLSFLKYFVHPDGSLGGVYGERNTEFYYPDGFEYYATRFADASAIASFMRDSIRDKSCVTLSAIDAPNLIPMFNSYCRAAVYAKAMKDAEALPAIRGDTVMKNFDKAGLIVMNTTDFYAVFSSKKGGAGVVFDKQSNVMRQDYGPLYEDERGRQYTTQGHDSEALVSIDEINSQLCIKTPLQEYKKMHPTPLQYIVLRCMNVSVMRFEFFNELIKKILVKYVIKGRKNTVGYNKRAISFGDEKIDIIDELELADGTALKLKCRENVKFYAIHMASQGYWKR